MSFAKQMLAAQKQLTQAGHTCRMPLQTKDYAAGKIIHGSEDSLNKIKHDVIRDHYGLISQSDAILVLNYDKNGVANYIGGNTFLEIGFAHVLGKKIFLLQPVPASELYRAEIEAMQPDVIGGDLSKVN
ncbi:MAG: hypothetical protein WC505_02220 [Patescibacteria group bacterium]